MRKEIADRWIKGGSGVEIGGLHCPLPVNGKVTYVDLMSSKELQEKFPEVDVKNLDIVVDNAETLSKFKADTKDFIIANHVLEHCEDVISTIQCWMEVLKPGGILYCAIPNKDYTFDKKRAVTKFDHLLKDYVQGSYWSLHEHYVDWFNNSELEGKADWKEKVDAAMESRSNIHFHVWDYPAMSEMFSKLSYVLDFEILEGSINGSEVIVVCKKL